VSEDRRPLVDTDDEIVTITWGAVRELQELPEHLDCVNRLIAHRHCQGSEAVETLYASTDVLWRSHVPPRASPRRHLEVLPVEQAGSGKPVHDPLRRTCPSLRRLNNRTGFQRVLSGPPEDVQDALVAATQARDGIDAGFSTRCQHSPASSGRAHSTSSWRESGWPKSRCGGLSGLLPGVDQQVDQGRVPLRLPGSREHGFDKRGVCLRQGQFRRRREHLLAPVSARLHACAPRHETDSHSVPEPVKSGETLGVRN